ncbi:hypothetical protein B1C78_12705 [Thioalkalivibrio denitrificans]|uniref:Uncharacterized protein n=1 Tax=Thioalkalivibrio denitrificans TaxID=108003 RepID=A0A1V3NDW4_9GAMM|nr:hypothetical protein B1C78_12705 [Thioalkalivibrio denitrificans]
MRLKTDADQFDQLQQLFIREIIEQIRLKLVQAGLRGKELQDLTTHIAFSVASTIDDTARIESGGVQVRPCLTFVTEDDQLVHGGENSYTHEYVADVVGEIFSNGAAD